jgi:hypothetical protein
MLKVTSFQCKVVHESLASSESLTPSSVSLHGVFVAVTSDDFRNYMVPFLVLLSCAVTVRGVFDSDVLSLETVIMQ